jgi:hypothetical protein
LTTFISALLMAGAASVSAQHYEHPLPADFNEPIRLYTTGLSLLEPDRHAGSDDSPESLFCPRAFVLGSRAIFDHRVNFEDHRLSEGHWRLPGLQSAGSASARNP